MSFWDKFMTEDIVFWGKPTTDGYGNEVYPEAVEFKGAYVEKTELFTRKDGKETMSRALIETNHDIEIDGYIWLGDIEELTSEEAADPTLLEDSFRVMRVDRSKMLNKTGVLVKGYL